jgi:hypothetical protein
MIRMMFLCGWFGFERFRTTGRKGRNMDARLNVTWAGQNGDLPDPVPFDASDADIRTWAGEAVRSGGVPGILSDANADFSNFVVDRFAVSAARDFPLIQLRPKADFGS